eukprot:gene25854-32351_t
MTSAWRVQSEVRNGCILSTNSKVFADMDNPENDLNTAHPVPVLQVQSGYRKWLQS